jgi:hypothetical protein
LTSWRKSCNMIPRKTAKSSRRYKRILKKVHYSTAAGWYTKFWKRKISRNFESRHKILRKKFFLWVSSLSSALEGSISSWVPHGSATCITIQGSIQKIVKICMHILYKVPKNLGTVVFILILDNLYKTVLFSTTLFHLINPVNP